MYTAPFIWIGAGNVSIQKKGRQDTGNQQNTGGKPDEGQEAEYKEEPSRETGSREKAGQELGNRQKPEENWITDMQKTVLEQELKRTGVSIENVLARYKKIQNKRSGMIAREQIIRWFWIV